MGSSYDEHCLILLLLLLFSVSAKDWRESHAQQVKHNYWQYTKVTYGVRNEEARFAEMLR